MSPGSMMRAVSGLVLFVALSTSSGCGWFGERSVPDPVQVAPEALGVALQAPKGWTVREEPELKRAILFPVKDGDRDHAVIVQRLADHLSWREHADRFREGQDTALDKIVKESEHEIAEGGVVFETRQVQEGRPVIRKLRYYVEVGNDAILLDMAAPEGTFDAGLYRAVAKTLGPTRAE